MKGEKKQEGRGRINACAGPLQAPLDRIDQGCGPVRHIQRRRCARQQVVAQGPQHLGQVAEQDLGNGVVLARAVTAHQRDQPVGGGALRVEVVEGWAGWVGVGLVGHCFPSFMKRRILVFSL